MNNIQIVKKFVNSHKYKMEIGAANNPICDGKYTTFVDDVEDILGETMKVIDIDKTTEFILADAGDIPVKSSSMDCIVSRNFVWYCAFPKKRLIYFFDMLSEWERIIKKTGFIVIMSIKDCIKDIMQMCDAVGLKVANVLEGRSYDGHDHTIILQKI